MTEIAAYIICLIFIGLASLQVLLAIGKPYGEFAWGGQHKILPKKLRLASIINIIIYFLFCLVALNGAGVINIFSEGTTTITIWILTIYMFSAIILNGISRSKKERNTITPLAIILFVCSLIITLNLA